MGLSADFRSITFRQAMNDSPSRSGSVCRPRTFIPSSTSSAANGSVMNIGWIRNTPSRNHTSRSERRGRKWRCSAPLRPSGGHHKLQSKLADFGTAALSFRVRLNPAFLSSGEAQAARCAESPSIAGQLNGKKTKRQPEDSRAQADALTAPPVVAHDDLRRLDARRARIDWSTPRFTVAKHTRAEDVARPRSAVPRRKWRGARPTSTA